VSKIRSNDPEDFAADLFTFVDDLRPCGPSKSEAWQAARRAASILNWLGIQDAARKRRDSSQKPGAWTVAVIKTDGENVWLLTSQEKWDKAKKLMKEMTELIALNPKAMPRRNPRVF
jgi:cytochrome P450